jgi:hypothetical protein
VIVNQGDYSNAKYLKKSFPNLSVGLYWNVTDGKPLNPCTKLESSIHPDAGEFWGVAEFIYKFNKRHISKDELRKELISQYNAFKDVCGEPDYWNSHMNSSLDFKTFHFFNSLAIELGMMKTRSFRRVYIKPIGLKGVIGRLREFVKRLVLDCWFGYQIPKTGTRMPGGKMTHFNSSDKTIDIKNIGKNVKWGNKEIVELVIHPSISAEYHNFGNLTTIRVEEWKMFTNPQTKEYLQN